MSPYLQALSDQNSDVNAESISTDIV
jgi:hypothetical protein